MMMMVVGGGSRYPFTASQWQELELQALVFKYMVSGIPVPPDLILCIRRSLFVEPQTLPFLPHPPTVGWEAYQVGDGRKAVDPEPGRCRRTDGKKWRCSKEAFPDSKYCERHMHRGKSRSRKPVELSLATTPISSHFRPPTAPPPPPPPLSLSTPHHTHHFLFPCSSSSSSSSTSSSSSRPPPMLAHSQQDDSSGYRSILGFRQDVNEHPFFSEACRGGREMMPFRLGPVEEEEKHYFVLGADFKTQRKGEAEREEPAQNLRPFHCFLDEKPSRVVDSWLGMEVDRSKQAPDLKTRLSITIPVANHDIPVTAPPCYSDG